MRAYLPLSLPLCIIFVLGSATATPSPTPDDLTIFKNALTSLSRSVINYESDFNNNLKFRDLQRSIDAVDNGLLGFRGTAKKHLDKVRSVNSDAYLTYGRSSGLALEWCVAFQSTSGILAASSKGNLSPNERDVIWKIVVSAVGQGLDKIGNTIPILNTVKQRRDQLHQELEEMHVDFGRDLNPGGYYDQETANAIRQDGELLRQLSSDIQSKFKSSGIGSNFATDAKSCLDTTFAGIKTHRKDELSKTIAGYHPIGTQIKTAAEIASIPDFDLEGDKADFDALKKRMKQEELVSPRS